MVIVFTSPSGSNTHRERVGMGKEGSCSKRKIVPVRMLIGVIFDIPDCSNMKMEIKVVKSVHQS